MSSSSKSKKYPRRIIRVVAVAAPRKRTESDPPDSIQMTVENMRTTAKHYHGKPILLYHGDDERKPKHYGLVRDSFVHNEKLNTMFDLECPEDDADAYFLGSEVLQGLIDGVSASTRGILDPNTGRVVSNCAEPEVLRAMGAKDTDPVLELSVCSSRDAARGPDCKILRATEWKLHEDGTWERVGNRYTGDTRTLVGASDEDVYKDAMQAVLDNDIPRHTFQQVLVEACAQRQLKIQQQQDTAMSDNDAQPSADKSAGSSGANQTTPSPVPDQVPKMSTTNESSSSSSTSQQQQQQQQPRPVKRESDDVDDAEEPEQKHTSRRVNNTSSTDDDIVARLMARVEQMERERTEEKLRGEREALVKQVAECLGPYCESLKLGGQDPEKDEVVQVLRKVGEIKTEKELAATRGMVTVVQKATIGQRHKDKQLHEMNKRLEEVQKEAERQNRSRQAAFNTERELSKRSNESGIASILGGTYPWDQLYSRPQQPQQEPPAQPSNLPSPGLINGQYRPTEAPSSSSSSSSSSSQQKSSTEQKDTPMEDAPAPANPNAKFFDTFEIGGGRAIIDIKATHRPHAAFSSDELINPDKLEQNIRVPPPPNAALHPDYDRSSAPVVDGESLLTTQPGLFLNIIKSGTNTLRTKLPREFSQTARGSMLLHPSKGAAWPVYSFVGGQERVDFETLPGY